MEKHQKNTKAGPFGSKSRCHEGLGELVGLAGRAAAAPGGFGRGGQAALGGDPEVRGATVALARRGVGPVGPFFGIFGAAWP